MHEVFEQQTAEISQQIALKNWLSRFYRFLLIV